MDLSSIMNELKPTIENARKEFAKQESVEWSEVSNKLKYIFDNIVCDLVSGKSIDEIAEHYDTQTLALCAASMFKITQSQQRALSQVQKILEGIVAIAMRQLIVGLVGI